MAKRELIDKNEIPFSCRHDCWTGNCIKCDEKTVAQYEINGMSVIPEEQIVKPYLEKLESKLLDCCDPRIRTETEIPIKKVLDFIDSLLTEKGVNE